MKSIFTKYRLQMIKEESHKYEISKNVVNVIRYLDIIEKLYKNKEDELLYSFTLPIREYKKK